MLADRCDLRRLAAAVLLVALREAQAGDAEAAAWLDGNGADLAERLGIPRPVWAQWRTTEAARHRIHYVAQGRRESSAERSRRYRAAKKAAREAKAKC